MAASSPKSKEIARSLARLRGAESVAVNPDDERVLRDALRSKDRELVVSASRIVALKRLDVFGPELTEAFQRLLRDPLKTDKGCLGKMAVVDALLAMDCHDPTAFLAGIRHCQMEPVYGGRADSADNLRANCALGLAQMGYPEVLFEVVTLLADPEVEARRGAIRALVYLGREESELLLRLKCLLGDQEVEVIGECLSGLMTLDHARSIEFVGSFLDHKDPVLAEHAAYALGESRSDEALALLMAKWESVLEPSFRRMLLVPIGLTRREKAFAFLLDALVSGPVDRSVAAIEALRLVCADDGQRKTVAQTVHDWDCPEITRAWRAHFDEA